MSARTTLASRVCRIRSLPPAGHGGPRVRRDRLTARGRRVLQRDRPLGMREIDAARNRRRLARQRRPGLFDGRAVAGDVPDGVGVVFQEDASFPGSRCGTTSRSVSAARGLAPRDPRRVDYALRSSVSDFAQRHPRSSRAGCASGSASRARSCSTAADPARRTVRRARSADAPLDGRRVLAPLARDRRDRAPHHARLGRGRHALGSHRRHVGATRSFHHPLATGWPRDRDSRS